MTCRKDSGVVVPADLKGKMIGVKVNAQPYFKLFLSKNNVPLDSVKTTTVGPNDVSLLIAGRIACEITTFAFNEPLLVQQAGVPTTVLPLGQYGLNAQADSFFVKESYFDKPANQATLVKFLHATAEGWVGFYKDPKAAANFIIDGHFVDGLDRTQQIFQAEQQVNYMKSPLTAEKGILWLDPVDLGGDGGELEGGGRHLHRHPDRAHPDHLDPRASRHAEVLRRGSRDEHHSGGRLGRHDEPATGRAGRGQHPDRGRPHRGRRQPDDALRGQPGLPRSSTAGDRSSSPAW